MKIQIKTHVSAPLSKVVAGFSDQKTLEQLTPPGLKLKIERFDGCQPGDETDLIPI